MAIKKFQNRSSTYKCEDCGKLTRDTGEGEKEVGLCQFCFRVSTYINSIYDGDMELENVPRKYRKKVEEGL